MMRSISCGVRLRNGSIRSISVSTSARKWRASAMARFSMSVLSIMPLFSMASAEPRFEAAQRAEAVEGIEVVTKRQAEAEATGLPAAEGAGTIRPRADWSGRWCLPASSLIRCEASTMKREMALSAMASRSRRVSELMGGRAFLLPPAMRRSPSPLPASRGPATRRPSCDAASAGKPGGAGFRGGRWCRCRAGAARALRPVLLRRCTGIQRATPGRLRRSRCCGSSLPPGGLLGGRLCRSARLCGGCRRHMLAVHHLLPFRLIGQHDAVEPVAVRITRVIAGFDLDLADEGDAGHLREALQKPRLAFAASLMSSGSSPSALSIIDRKVDLVIFQPMDTPCSSTLPPSDGEDLPELPPRIGALDDGELRIDLLHIAAGRVRGLEKPGIDGARTIDRRQA